MIYEEYHAMSIKYQEAKQKLDEIISEKERLFFMTQPKAVSIKADKVDGGEYVNEFDQYLTALEDQQIDQKIEEAKHILTEREHLLRLVEIDLRRSSQLYDKVYRMHYLDNLNAYIIARKLYYSKSQIYNIIERIKHRLRSGENWINHSI